MRPRYETTESLNKEKSIKDILEKAWDVKLYKLPIHYYIDWVGFCNKTGKTGFVEYKNRKNSKDKYDDYMLSLHKIQHGINLAELTNGNFYIVVEWDDGVLWWTTLNKEKLNKCRLGFQNVDFRNDPVDKEPCYYIPINLFFKKVIIK